MLIKLQICKYNLYIMLIKPIHIFKIVAFFKFITSFSIINPLTLLIIPIIGSVIILSYPFFNQVQKDISIENQASQKNNEQIEQSKNSQIVMINNTEATYDTCNVASVERSQAIKELINMPHLDKQNSNLKKIAILISLINFFVSLLL